MEPRFLPGDLKQYPHFDAPLPIPEINALVSDPLRVAQNQFFPFLKYDEEWQPYRKPAVGPRPEKKSRPIRYSSRRDSYIFAHYRRILSEKYEAKLVENNISDCPIAYRSLPKSSGYGGKCNIDFAKDAFDEIECLGDCVAIALDIRSYFERLDHMRIKTIWCSLINEPKLPDDHFAVFKNITRYNYVDQRKIYERLGYFGQFVRDEHLIEGYIVPFNKIPQRLCTPEIFRQKFAGLTPNSQV